jgi:hypothetical protein
MAGLARRGVVRREIVEGNRQQNREGSLARDGEMPSRAVIDLRSGAMHFEFRLRHRDHRRGNGDCDQRYSQMLEERLHGTASTSASGGQFLRLSEVRPSRRHRVPWRGTATIQRRRRARDAVVPGEIRQDKQKRRLPEGKRRFVLIVTRKEELLCLWQAWQRPTLPGLKP